MARRTSIALAALLALAALAPGAGGQETNALRFQHDGALDGTPAEIHSGLYAGDPAGGDPIAARYARTYETFSVTVPETTRHSSLTAAIAWNDARVNLEVSVYKVGGDGRAQAPAVARSASTGRAGEAAVYAPTGATVPPGRYLVVVDNVCSRDADDDPRSPDPSKRANCGIGAQVPDEDTFTGTVTLGNQIPSVTLTGPDSTRARESTTFTAVAADNDGTISAYLFDLDGDGVYELDSDGNSEVATTFPSRGPRTIGVQVLDDSGAVAIATKAVTVTRAAKQPDMRPPLMEFRLSRKTFGGAAKRRLVVIYKLREKARVELKLRRKTKLVRVIGRGVRTGKRTYRIPLRPMHLRRGVYTVRINVAAASGKHQVESLRARRY